ncbi:hypothetical protein FRB98_004293 [Tulasnella sp. 332]|nr:hypothetical protein FRB98_004293 [Tulasnella sp. 332]
MTGEEPLSDAELMGNIYIYLLAGHETTAHSIAFTFGLLAMNPKAQEKLYQHVMEFMPEDGVTDYEAFYPLFDYVRAVYFETLRMFPPVQQIPKIVAYDTVLILPETNAHNVELGLAREAQTQKLEGPSPITPPSTPTRLSSSESNSSVASTRSSASSSSSSTDSNLDSGSPLDMSPSSSTTSLSSVEEDEKDVCAATFAESVVPLTTIGDSSVVEAQALSLPLVPAADEIRLASGATWTRSTTTTSVNDRIPTPTVLPGQKSLLVEKDTIIFVDPPAVHYNPKYYPEPYEFRPERFIGAYDEKAFIPFSSGTRVCLGRRFSEVESVVVIAYMIREFSIHPIPLRNEKTGDVIKETRDEMMARMFRATPKITLTPHEMPIMFRKRKDGSGVVPEDAFP